MGDVVNGLWPLCVRDLRTTRFGGKPGGGYALGTGNSVTNYIPVRNYIAMLDEGMKVGWYR